MAKPSDVVIAIRAYEIWEEQGRPHGRDQEHWLLAVAELSDDGVVKETLLEIVEPETAAPKAAAAKAAPKVAAAKPAAKPAGGRSGRGEAGGGGDRAGPRPRRRPRRRRRNKNAERGPLPGCPGRPAGTTTCHLRASGDQ